MNSEEEGLFNSDPSKYLPHRYPFLLLDRIISREPGVSAVALTQLSGNTIGFSPFLMIEGLAQLAGVATVEGEGEGGFLAAIDHAVFLAPCRSGDILEFSVRVEKSFGRLYLLVGEVHAAGKLLVQARLTLGVGKL